jgi:arabinogalactan oligomer / maltooligosaccharide transport system permease protein
MAGWSGRRKYLTVIMFTAPTLIGILVFNIYPILFNTYISFTNRNQFRPNPNCEVALTGILEPSCWPVFTGSSPRIATNTYTLQTPLWGNYSNLVGRIFTPEGLLALARFVFAFTPLIVANYVNKHLDRQVTRTVSSLLVWATAAVATVGLIYLLDLGGAYRILERSGDFFIVVFRTILYVIACVPLFFALGLMLALILNGEHIRFRTFWRAAMIVPWASSTMAIMMSLIWQFFFREQGTINQLLRVAGLDRVLWLSNPTYAFAIVVLVNLWFSYPFFFTVILGSLQSIPPEQYEAAEMDGASFWQQLVYITLPLIRPAILPAVVLSSITTFQMFGTVWAITAGGPSRGAGAPGATELVMVYAYKQVFQFNAFAKAGAFAVIIFIFLFIATIYSLRMTRITKGAYE